jgi:aspartyl-tRNA(Asn)/glutamyl-tRNA(Gln) amidotransferase subunit A
VRYGHRAADYTSTWPTCTRRPRQGFGDEVKRRIMIGTYVLSHGYYDAYYLQAQKLRRMIADDFQRAFGSATSSPARCRPTVAWPLGKQRRSGGNYLADIYTLPASLAGLPGMSVPAGFGAGGLPVGLQLIGNYLQEGRLLNVAHQPAAGHRLAHPQAPRVLTRGRTP